MTDDQDIRARKYGEAVYNTLSTVASVLEYPKGEYKRHSPQPLASSTNWQWCSFRRRTDLIKDSARPSYWVPDSDREAHFCCVCTRPFGTAEELASNTNKSGSSASSSQNSNTAIAMEDAAGNLCDRKRHHCRSCGQAVCDNCSQNRHPVPERGWLTDVRVCDTCNKKSPFL